MQLGAFWQLHNSWQKRMGQLANTKDYGGGIGTFATVYRDLLGSVVCVVVALVERCGNVVNSTSTCM